MSRADRKRAKSAAVKHKSPVKKAIKKIVSPAIKLTPLEFM
jgi:hypothetical protein